MATSTSSPSSRPSALRLAALLLCAVFATVHSRADAAQRAGDPPKQAAGKPVMKPASPGNSVEESVLESDIALLVRLEKPFAEPTSFRDATAGDVVNAVRKETNIPVEMDRRALGDAGGWEFIRLTCDPKTPRDALDAVVRAVSPDYEKYALDVASGIVVITDSAGQGRLRAATRYSYGSLLSRLATTGEANAEGEGAHEADADTTDSPTATLTRYIELIEPDAWKSNGGDLASIDFTGTVASIRATPAMHRAIRRAIEDLVRELPANNLLWSVRVLVLEQSAKDDEIVEAVASTAGVDALIASGGATVISSPKLLSQRTKAATISIGNDAAKLDVEILPMHRTTEESFVVKVTETTTGGDANKPANSTTRGITMRATPGSRCAAALQGDGRRLLIELTGFSESAMRVINEAAAKAAAAEAPAKAPAAANAPVAPPAASPADPK